MYFFSRQKLREQVAKGVTDSLSNHIDESLEKFHQRLTQPEQEEEGDEGDQEEDAEKSKDKVGFWCFIRILENPLRINFPYGAKNSVAPTGANCVGAVAIAAGCGCGDSPHRYLNSET